MEETPRGGGVGLEAVAHSFPAPEALAPADGSPAVTLGFPVPVPLIREVASSRSTSPVSSGVASEIGAAALALLLGDLAVAADLLRRYAPRIGIGPWSTLG